MSKHESILAYRHMLENAQKATGLVKGKKRTFLDDEWVTTLALVRLLEVIGEAANRVPENEQRQHSEIPWVQIVGMRNRLIHGYDSIDLDILWQVLTQDLPPLIKALQQIIRSFK